MKFQIYGVVLGCLHWAVFFFWGKKDVYVPELLISGFAVKAGLYSLVLVSLAGSILGNILLVMGMSIFTGGIKFSFKLASGEKTGSESMVKFSLALAIIMVILYALGLLFSLITHAELIAAYIILGGAFLMFGI